MRQGVCSLVEGLFAGETKVHRNYNDKFSWSRSPRSLDRSILWYVQIRSQKHYLFGLVRLQTEADSGWTEADSGWTEAPRTEWSDLFDLIRVIRSLAGLKPAIYLANLKNTVSFWFGAVATSCSGWTNADSSWTEAPDQSDQIFGLCTLHSNLTKCCRALRPICVSITSDLADFNVVFCKPTAIFTCGVNELPHTPQWSVVARNYYIFCLITWRTENNKTTASQHTLAVADFFSRDKNGAATKL